MPNLNYAEQWSPELLAILMQGTLTSPLSQAMSDG